MRLAWRKREESGPDLRAASRKPRELVPRQAAGGSASGAGPGAGGAGSVLRRGQREAKCSQCMARGFCVTDDVLRAARLL